MVISIIIPTKDRAEIFNETLESVVQAIEGLAAEIIVINDSKSSEPPIPNRFKSVRLVTNSKSGVASARNLGASIAQSELLLFMDDDFLITRESILRVIEFSSQHPRKIHLFNWIYPPSVQASLSATQFGRYMKAFGFTTLQGWLAEGWKEEEVFELKGGASYFLPIRKVLFNEIGGYHESFPHAGAEDYYFIQEAGKKGIKFYVDKTCTLYHNEKDRLVIKKWLERKRRNGETLRMAVQLGRSEMAIYYTPYKSLLLSILYKMRGFFLISQKIVPNVTWLDPVYFKMTNILLAAYIFNGYNKVR